MFINNLCTWTYTLLVVLTIEACFTNALIIAVCINAVRGFKEELISICNPTTYKLWGSKSVAKKYNAWQKDPRQKGSTPCIKVEWFLSKLYSFFLQSRYIRLKGCFSSSVVKYDLEDARFIISNSPSYNWHLSWSSSHSSTSMQEILSLISV